MSLNKNRFKFIKQYKNYKKQGAFLIPLVKNLGNMYGTNYKKV